MTNRAHKKNNGNCPYCEEGASQEYVLDRTLLNNRLVQKHVVCNLYSVFDNTTGIRYPLQKPEDKNSSAYL